MTSRSALRRLSLALLLVPLGAWSQPVAAPPLQAGVAPALQDWRGANDAVAQFKRGHIDLLKWESANLPAESATSVAAPNLALMAPADAVRQAWRAHLDLRRTQSRLGAENTQRIAEGRWDTVDPSLQRRVDDMDELLEVAADARKTWLQAVASRKALRFREAALTSAEAGNELGRRMVSVGNWSPLQSTPFRLATANARMALSQARLASAQADGTLLDLLRLRGTDTRLDLPSELPELPATAMTRDAWAQRLAAVQAHVPGMDAVRNKVASETAFMVYEASEGMARVARGEVLAVRRYITEETVLHYNGMLKSVWDLLDEVSNQAGAEVDAIAAQRDFWLAEADLQWTLQGGAPTSFVSLGGGAAEAAKPAGH
ncbi:MAG: outer membrane protein TolC [Hydrogenophaga sp.]|jgi:outer membrane protein TolC